MNSHNIFKYGRKFDRTLFWLAFSVIAIPLTLSQFIVRKDRLPEGVEQNLKVKTRLLTDDMESEVYLRPGTGVRLIGYLEANYSNPHRFWVETSDGQRGFLATQAVDDKMIVSPEPTLKKQDTTSFEYTHRGDTVRVVGWEKSFSKYTVVTGDGKKHEVSHKALIPPLATKLPFVAPFGEGWRPMSEKKFVKMFMDQSLADAQKKHYPAEFIVNDKSGVTRACFPVRVFKGGAFYSPVVTYDASTGMPSGYEFPEHSTTSVNKWFLKFVPFYGSICNLPFVWPLWTKGIYYKGGMDKIMQYQMGVRASGSSPLTMTIVTFAIFFPLLIIYLLFMPFVFSFLVIGLLRFPPVFKNISNARLYGLLKLGTFILALIWILISLSDYYLIPLLVGTAAVWWLFNRQVNRLLGEGNPEVRCPSCAVLYSTEFDRKVEEGERTGAMERREYLENDTVTSVEKWQTYTEVTTTYGDGHQTKHKENIQNHERKHGQRTYGTYDEIVEYIPYTTYYICRECGHIEKEYTKDRNVLSRTKVGGYVEYY